MSQNNVQGFWKSAHSQFRTAQPVAFVARTDEEWQRLWVMMFGHNRQQVPTLPQGKMAVAVFIGQRSSGGYSVDIPKPPVPLRGQKTINVLAIESAPKGIATAALTNPSAVRWVSDYTGCELRVGLNSARGVLDLVPQPVP